MRLLLTAFVLLLSFLTKHALAQLYIPDSNIVFVGDGALLFSGVDIENKGYLQNDKEIVIEGDFTNTGNIISSGLIVVTGIDSQRLSLAGNNAIKSVTINKTGGEASVIDANLTIEDSLILYKGRLNLGNYNVFASLVSGGSDSSFVFTSASGRLITSLAPSQQFKFPVGFVSFSPVTIQNMSGIQDTFSVRVLQDVLTNGLTGVPISNARVLKTWDIQRQNNNPSGILNVTFEWKPSDANGISNPTLNQFNNTNWVPQYGSSFFTPGSLSFSSYTGQPSLFSVQNYYETKIQLKAFLQGYYTTAGSLRPALLNSGISAADPSNADSVLISLHNPEDGSLAALPVQTMLKTDGSIIAAFPGMAGPYYISLRHRNSIETWTADPVLMDTTVHYDFTTAANKAFGSNQTTVANNVYAIYSGDINQDGMLESADYLSMENEILSVLFGYYPADLTGNGAVESDDYVLMENNLTQVIFVQKPF